MKILVAHDVGRSRNGGMSRIMGLLHDDIEAAGHRVDYLCSEDVPRKGLHPGMNRFAFPLAALAHAAAAAKAGEPYHIVNVHEPSGAALVARRGQLGGARIVVTSHGVEERGWRRRLDAAADPDERPSMKTRILYPTTLLWQAGLSLRRADHIFCLNTDDQRYLCERFGRGSDETTRIFPGADAIYGARAGQRDYGRARVLLFAGSWLVRKGIRDLVVAFDRLGQAHPELRLHILNPGAPVETILKQFPEGVRGRVEIVRAHPEEGTAKAMEAADIFVLPSLFEGTPLTMMEAMGSGLPLVSTAVCGMKDVIQHERNGLLIPPRDPDALVRAVETLLERPWLRERVGRQAHSDCMGKYQWSHGSAIVRKAYERLMAEAPVTGLKQLATTGA